MRPGPKSLATIFAIGILAFHFAANGATGVDPGVFPAAQQRLAELTSISASISPTGGVTYKFAGYHPAIQGAAFSGEGGYDPKTGKASERLDLPGGKINSLATCNGDPWADIVSCTSPAVTASSGAPVDMALLPYGPPVAAMLLSPGARNRVKAALAEALRNRPTATHSYTPTPTRTPTPRLRAAMLAPTATPTPHLGRAGTLAGGGVAAAVTLPTATRTPTPTATRAAAPSGTLFGAAYLPGPSPARLVSARKSISVTILVRNTSSRVWDANGPIHLSYHWTQGGAVVVYEGKHTKLPVSVPPGGEILLNAALDTPGPGTYVLKWDMIEMPGTWFSTKGVPTLDQTVVVGL